MGQLRDALGAVCPDIEGRAKARLSVPSGGGLREWLPQSWVFETDIETATLHIDAEGNATAAEGSHGEGDINVIWDQGHLIEVLTAKVRSASFIGANPKLRFRTVNGQRAFNLLRGALGL
ncbi:MAG: hypothetical protein L3K14_09335 [Thermoplasmata archaeon]|nr:hypothetical protein [Thermoplasmata archaeon]